jgi:hypothetical protein
VAAECAVIYEDAASGSVLPQKAQNFFFDDPALDVSLKLSAPTMFG